MPSKGFDRSTGEIMYWLNNDDMLQRRALWVVAEVMQAFPDVEWLTGIASEYHPDGHNVRRITLQWSRWSRTRYLTWDFQFIQQESTFWKRSLWEKGEFHGPDGHAARWRFGVVDEVFPPCQAAYRAEPAGRLPLPPRRATLKDQQVAYLNECMDVIQAEKGRACPL
ncbi:MAG: hypothetical protein U0176_04785 [Bacteroidia bacterium]